MKYNPTARTFDCAPTLNDREVLAFCRDGHLLLPGVVPEEINRRVCDWLDRKVPATPSYLPEGLTHADLERIRGTHEPSGILLEEWFLEHVLLNPRLAGVMRSLLGPDIGLPVLVSHHFMQCPAAAQRWHHDADSVFGPELRFVEVFYFPQDTPAELGPTELVPGSHLGRTQADEGTVGVLSAGPAGTIGVHHQSILHRRAASTASGPRRMLKYSYWRHRAAAARLARRCELRPAHRRLRRPRPGALRGAPVRLAVRQRRPVPRHRRAGLAVAHREPDRSLLRLRQRRGLPPRLAQQQRRRLCPAARNP